MTRADDLAALGVAANATEPEIRTAYRAKALRHHPALGGDPQIMATISNAYERLLDREPGVEQAEPHLQPVTVEPDDAPDDFTIGHSMLAFVVVPVILAVILFLGVFSVLSTIL